MEECDGKVQLAAILAHGSSSWTKQAQSSTTSRRCTIQLGLLRQLGSVNGCFVHPSSQRAQSGVAILFAVLLVVPGLVTLLPSPWNHNVTKYLPSSAGTAMGAVVHVPNLLGPLAGFLVLSAYTAATLVAAGIVVSRRDA
jgi:hypothetical protein